jgi:hypothetical protein
VVQRLPSMREALGSIPAPKREKTKKKKGYTSEICRLI